MYAGNGGYRKKEEETNTTTSTTPTEADSVEKRKEPDEPLSPNKRYDPRKVPD